MIRAQWKIKIQSITGSMRGIRTPAIGNHIIKYKANSITIRAFSPPATMAFNGSVSYCFRNAPIQGASTRHCLSLNARRFRTLERSVTFDFFGRLPSGEFLDQTVLMTKTIIYGVPTGPGVNPLESQPIRCAA